MDYGGAGGEAPAEVDGLFPKDRVFLDGPVVEACCKYSSGGHEAHYAKRFLGEKEEIVQKRVVGMQAGRRGCNDDNAPVLSGDFARGYGEFEILEPVGGIYFYVDPLFAFEVGESDPAGATVTRFAEGREDAVAGV